MTNPTDLAALAPCPFCGGEAVINGNDEVGFFVACKTEGCCMENSASWSDEKLRKSWNTRALASRAVVPEGWVCVPVEPTEEMLAAGRFAVMARDCSSAKWSPAQHYEACGASTEGIPADELAGYHSIIPKEQGATLVWFAMLAAASKAAPLPGAVGSEL